VVKILDFLILTAISLTFGMETISTKQILNGLSQKSSLPIDYRPSVKPIMLYSSITERLSNMEHLNNSLTKGGVFEHIGRSKGYSNFRKKLCNF
jgi:hypothetical protein